MKTVIAAFLLVCVSAAVANLNSTESLNMEDCGTKAMEMRADILPKLVPCLAFDLAPAMCCENINSLVGTGGPLSYCLCDETYFSDLSEMAKAYSLDIEEIGAKCNDPAMLNAMIPYNGNSYCPMEA
eukprot:scaffold101997_cov25-Prasinocladus_malaysianus.AAC.2